MEFKAIGAELNRQREKQSLQLTAESVAIARETAAVVSEQSESLARSEAKIDQTYQTVQVANHVVRGMTWSGWLYNKFVNEPNIHLTTNAAHSSTSGQISMGFICPECRVNLPSQRELVTHYESNHSGENDSFAPNSKRSNSLTVEKGTTTSTIQEPFTRQNRRSLKPSQSVTMEDLSFSKEQNTFLNTLMPQLMELKEASLSISHALDAQNKQLDRIGNKTETTKDNMRKVTAKAIHLTGTNGEKDIQFRFRCAIQEQETKTFVANFKGEPIAYKPTATEDCIFRAYTLGNTTDIWGFQSELSSKYLGVNKFGQLKVIGEDFTSCEQFAIDIDREFTTFYNFASFFNSGGWVRRKSTGGQLYFTFGGMKNKNKASMFHIVQLMENTAAEES